MYIGISVGGLFLFGVLCFWRFRARRSRKEVNPVELANSYTPPTAVSGPENQSSINKLNDTQVPLLKIDAHQ